MPQELRDFIACVRDTFTLSSGKADWLPIPGTITLLAPLLARPPA